MNDGWNQLDTVRLILAAIVAVGHAVGIFAHPFGFASEWLNETLSDASIFAVLAFFLISGLVIGRSLQRLSKKSDLIITSFMWRRFLRIYPPLLFSVVLCVGLAEILHATGMDHYRGNAEPVRTGFSYLENFRDVVIALMTFGFRGGLTGSSNGPLWSLALEMQAYVFAGLAVQIWVARAWEWKAVTAIILVVALRKRGALDLDLYHWGCFALFALGLALSRANLKFPHILPIVKIDFSYSLYILHFPLMLFVFFVTCQHRPTADFAWVMVVTSLAASLAISAGSGLTLERWRYFFRKEPKSERSIVFERQ